jgi:hypothetical protein
VGCTRRWHNSPSGAGGTPRARSSATSARALPAVPLNAAVWAGSSRWSATSWVPPGIVTSRALGMVAARPRHSPVGLMGRRRTTGHAGLNRTQCARGLRLRVGMFQLGGRPTPTWVPVRIPVVSPACERRGIGRQALRRCWKGIAMTALAHPAGHRTALPRPTKEAIEVLHLRKTTASALPSGSSASTCPIRVAPAWS